MPSGRSKSVFRKILTISSLPALLAASYFYYPVSQAGPPMCFFKLSLGVPCLGCGLTRAFCCLAHGDIVSALQFHFLAPLVLSYFAVWYLIGLTRLYNPTFSPKWFAGFGRWMMILLALLYAGRMVKFFSAPEGAHSLLLQNGVMRIIRLDLSNTYEP